MKWLTKFSLKNSTAVVILAVLVVAAGFWSAGQLKQETMPDITIPVVSAITVYPGASPADVEDQVTKPIETALQSVPGVKRVTGQSMDSVSAVVTEFSFSADMDKAEADVKKALEGVKLPDTAVASKVARFSFGSAPIMRLAITTDAKNEDALRQTVNDDLIPALNGVEGVGEAKVVNDAKGTVQIKLDPKKLRKHGLTASGVVQQLQAANLSFPVGSVDVASTNQPVRVSGTYESVKDLKDVRIAITPNQMTMLTPAFKAIGEGFGQLGSAVGQLGQGMGALGQGMGQLGGAVGQLGQGMGQLGQGLGFVSANYGQQLGMINALQSLQVQLIDAKMAYADAQQRANQAQLVIDNPASTPAQIGEAQGKKAGAEAQMAQMKPAIDGMTAGVSQLSGEITKLQKAAMAEAKSAAASGSNSGSGSASMSSGGASMSMPSGGSSSGSSKSSMSGLSMKAPSSLKTVKLSEIATIEYVAGGEVVTGRSDGKPAVLISVIKAQDGNTVNVTEGVRAKLAEQQSKLPKGSEIIYVYDASKSIKASVNGMLREGLLGAVFAFLIILLFLRNWRSTLIAAISIPLSVFGALVLLGYFDVTLNVMTLGGLTVAVGRVVDDSIVVIENIFRHFQLGEPRNIDTIFKATTEVSSAITSSTLTTIAVFLPLGLVSGVVGKIFQPFALTVGVALACSLLVAVTIVPLMSKWLLTRGKIKHEDEGGTKSAQWYKRQLAWALDHRALVLGGAALLFIGSLALTPFIGTGFVPESKEKYLNIEVQYPEGALQQTTDKTLTKVEEVLLKQPEGTIELYQAQVGSEGNFDMSAGSLGPNKAALFVRLGEGVKTDDIVADLQKEFRPLQTGGAKINITRQSVSGSNNTVDVIVKGDDVKQIRTVSDEVVAKLQDVPNLENVKSNLSTERKQVSVTVDQEKAAKAGLNAAMVAGTVRNFVADSEVGTMKIDGRTVDVQYGLKFPKETTIEELRDLELDTMTGGKVKLAKVAKVREVETPVAVYTRDGQQYADVSGFINARETGGTISAVKEKVAEITPPAGVTLEVGGAAEQMSESFSQLGLAMLVAIFAVYIVMVIAFGEAAAPLAILFSLPLAVIGGLVGLFVMRLPIDIPAMIGALMLIGIVVTNAIVLLDRVKQNEERGESRREALLDAGSTRMRPILMTALATIGALVPLASGFAEGALISQSLAVIVIGGLISSTALTLLVVPIAYDLIEGAKEWLFSLGTSKDKKHRRGRRSADSDQDVDTGSGSEDGSSANPPSDPQPQE